jgi:hypothetical protein
MFLNSSFIQVRVLAPRGAEHGEEDLLRFLRAARPQGGHEVPTSLTKDEHWVVDAFPQLFPTGLFGLYHPRERKLTTQQYFCQRLQNIAKRFCSNTAFLFAALYCITRQRLESALGVLRRRRRILVHDERSGVVVGRHRVGLVVLVLPEVKVKVLLNLSQICLL